MRPRTRDATASWRLRKPPPEHSRLLEQVVEPRLRALLCGLPARRVSDRPLAKLEELAEVGLLLLRTPLGLRFRALVVDRAIEEAAVEAALEIGMAGRA